MRRWLFSRLIWRALGREPGRVALALLAVALGVSVFLAIRLANRAAVASFEGFAQGIGSELAAVHSAIGKYNAVIEKADIQVFLYQIGHIVLIFSARYGVDYK